MALYPLRREAGTKQLRAQPTGWTAPQGSYTVILGYDTPGRTEFVDIGHGVVVYQDLIFPTTLRTIRAACRLRGPSSVPAGTKWVFQLRLDLVPLYERTIEVGRTVDVHDAVMNVTQYADGVTTRTVGAGIFLVSA